MIEKNRRRQRHGVIKPATHRGEDAWNSKRIGQIKR